jgi:hypothetical protein
MSKSVGTKKAGKPNDCLVSRLFSQAQSLVQRNRFLKFVRIERAPVPLDKPYIGEIIATVQQCQQRSFTAATQTQGLNFKHCKYAAFFDDL